MKITRSQYSRYKRKFTLDGPDSVVVGGSARSREGDRSTCISHSDGQLCCYPHYLDGIIVSLYVTDFLVGIHTCHLQSCCESPVYSASS